MRHYGNQKIGSRYPKERGTEPPLQFWLLARTGRHDERSAELPPEETTLDPARLVSSCLDHLPGCGFIGLSFLRDRVAVGSFGV